MRALVLLALAGVISLMHPAAGQTISDDSLATVLSNFSEYCANVREQMELTDPDAENVVLKPDAIKVFSTDQGQVTVLDGGGLWCKSGGYGYCGVAKCTAWVFYREKAQPFLGTVITEYKGDEIRLTLCEGPKPNTGRCREIDLSLFRSD